MDPDDFGVVVLNWAREALETLRHENCPEAIKAIDDALDLLEEYLHELDELLT